ncbi:PEP-CTERM sorting domain-containing protein [Chitinimonas naiadis]
MKKYLASAALVVACFAPAIAAPATYNNALNAGKTAFDATVTGTGATVSTVQLNVGQSAYNYIDKDGNNATVTVTRSNGDPIAWDSGYTSGTTSLTGAVVNINPSASGSDPVPGYGSGLTFTFSSGVNAFGFEIGDWATCCQNNTRPANIVSTYGVPAGGTGLWIGFDGGALRLIANSTDPNGLDNPGWAQTQSFTNFIGSIDDTGFFTSVTFFGDGFGEFLVAGGTLRFASVPRGSVSVPEPASVALIGLGLVALVARRRRAV